MANQMLHWSVLTGTLKVSADIINVNNAQHLKHLDLCFFFPAEALQEQWPQAKTAPFTHWTLTRLIIDMENLLDSEESIPE